MSNNKQKLIKNALPHTWNFIYSSIVHDLNNYSRTRVLGYTCLRPFLDLILRFARIRINRYS